MEMCDRTGRTRLYILVIILFGEADTDCYRIKPVCFAHSKFALLFGPNGRKPVFGVSDKGGFEPACTATETSNKHEILLVAI